MRSRTSASATPMPGRKAASRSGGHSPPGSALQAWTRASVARGAADDRRGPPITTLSSPGGRPVITRACTSSDIPLRLHQLELLGCLAQQLAHGATKLEHLATVAAVLERVPVSGRCAAAGGSAVHPATFPAGDRQGLPLRVRAPQRRLRFMGDGSGCMGLILIFLVAPSPALGDGADDRPAARVDVDVLDP